jgi:phosphohistidine phosphatase
VNVASGHHWLHLLRHAKSSWADAGLDDHDRLLAPRGEKAVRRIGEHLAGDAHPPELVLCSSARRTTMTLAGIAGALPAGVETSIEDALYGASGAELLERLRRISDDVDDVMLIGHNPGLEDLAELLVGAGDPALRAQLATKYPTGALATMSFTGSWAALGPGRVTLEGYVVPRDL